MLKNFNMQDAKPVSIPLLNHFRLSCNQCPKNEKNKKKKKLKTCQSCDAQVILDINCVVWVFLESHIRYIVIVKALLTIIKSFNCN